MNTRSFLEKTRVWICLLFINTVSRYAILCILSEILLIIYVRHNLHLITFIVMAFYFCISAAALIFVDFGCKPVESYASIRRAHFSADTNLLTLERYYKMRHRQMPPCKKSSLWLAIRDIRRFERKHGKPTENRFTIIVVVGKVN